MKYTFTLLEIKIPMFTLAEVFRVKPVSKTLSCESITFRLFILEEKKKTANIHCTISKAEKDSNFYSCKNKYKIISFKNIGQTASSFLRIHTVRICAYEYTY